MTDGLLSLVPVIIGAGLVVKLTDVMLKPEEKKDTWTENKWQRPGMMVW